MSRRNHPCSSSHYTCRLPRHEVSQERPVKVVALARRTEGGLPVVGAHLPFHFRETVDAVKRGEFGVARPLNSGVMDLAGRLLLPFLRAEGDGDGDGRLDGEDVFVLTRAASLPAEIENPYFVAQTAHVLAHPAEGGAVEVT